MSTTIRAYYVKGIDPNGHVIELAKFFEPEHAKAHMARFTGTTPGKQAGWREVGITFVDEPLDSQHPAHLEAITAPEQK